MRFFAPLGVLLVILGEGLAFVHILPWSQYVFPLFWYGYILIVDWLNLRRQSRYRAFKILTASATSGRWLVPQ